jgi:hypothetical protein
MAFRREALLEVGGFRDEVGRVGTLPAGCEETELSIRLLEHRPSDQIMFEPAALVHHHVAANRSQWAYFQSRCYHEGRSKAVVSRLRGRRSGLSSEFRYTAVILPTGVGRALGSVLRGDLGGFGRAAAIVLGLGFTTAGYVAAGLRLRRTGASAAHDPSATTTSSAAEPEAIR